MAGKNFDKIRCSFCNKSEDQVRKLIAGPGGVYICDECIDVCSEILEDELAEEDMELAQSEINLRTPVEIKAFLDEYVIGQEEAKKTLRRVVVLFTSYLMAHDPFSITDNGAKAFVNGKKQFNDLNPEQRKNLEFCYGRLLPLMVEQGLGKQEIEPYFERYMELFGEDGFDGKKGEHYDDIENIRKKVKGK